MLRLTISRRVVLCVGIACLALATLAVVMVQDRSDGSGAASLDALDSVAEPTAVAIESTIRVRIDHLGVAGVALGEGASTEAIVAELERSGFVQVERLADVGTSRLGATPNLLQRSEESPAVGATRSIRDRVTVIAAAPVIGAEATGDRLIGAIDMTSSVDVVAAARSGETAEALLAARNSTGEIVVFTPSRHNGDRPLAQVDPATAALVERALEEGRVEIENTPLNRRESHAVLRAIDGIEWVVIAAMDSDEAVTDGIPTWFVPAVAIIALLSLIPFVPVRRRIRDVVRAGNQLARGGLTHTISDTTDDEVGEIARTLKALDERLESDTEERGRSAAKLQHRATHDPLTGLANRARLMEELNDALDRRDPLAVIFCDIDDFKGINDSQGHEGGDVVLKHVANQLASVGGPTELISRFGGDEFCVLTRTEPQTARSIASRIERALDSSVAVNDGQQRVSGSVGLAIAKVTDTPDTLLKSADLAMYREKERRRGLRRARRSAEETEISPEQIRLAFQPVIEMVDQQIIGVEVLARYMHPELGMLDPSSFLPPGTEQGMFDKLDLEILTRSIAQLSEWLGQGVVDERFTMSLNLSPDHVSDSLSTKEIFEILRQHRVPSTMLQVEVTEQALSAHEDDLRHSLTVLRERGIKIAIDDFGVQGSNVDRLIAIPSDVVKIDRSLVSEIDSDVRAENRLRHVLEIISGEERVAIAEGVERQAQARVLRDLRVPFGQGYLWHAPISALALTPLLGRASRWTRKKPPPTR